MSWSAKQYTTFEDERTRPVRDLVAAIPPVDAADIVDLGCGPGNSTEVLMARFPGATVSGVDSSPDMVEAARKRLPHVPFGVADVRTWDAPGPYGVILSNAVMQWVEGHDALFPSLVRRLVPGGSLAIQMPDNLEEPAHRLMRSVAADGPWAETLAGAAHARVPRREAAEYDAMLRPHCTRLDIWRTTYFHRLAGGADAVVEWFKGSGLRPFLQPLGPELQAAFLKRYLAGIADAYPAAADGAVLLPFPRLFLVATR